MALSCLVVNFFGPTEMLKNKTSHEVHVHTLYVKNKNIKFVLQTSQSEEGIHILMAMYESEKQLWHNG